MSTLRICDRIGCGKLIDRVDAYAEINGQDYCSAKCVVLALGGYWSGPSIGTMVAGSPILIKGSYIEKTSAGHRVTVRGPDDKLGLIVPPYLIVSVEREEP